jgi:hypothetical protein
MAQTFGFLVATLGESLSGSSSAKRASDFAAFWPEFGRGELQAARRDADLAGDLHSGIGVLFSGPVICRRDR